jgi:hypothetical protein
MYLIMSLHDCSLGLEKKREKDNIEDMKEIEKEI